MLGTKIVNIVLFFQLVAVATSVNHARLIDPKSGSDAHELRGHEQGAVVCCRYWVRNSKEMHALPYQEMYPSRIIVATTPQTETKKIARHNTLTFFKKKVDKKASNLSEEGLECCFCFCCFCFLMK